MRLLLLCALACLAGCSHDDGALPRRHVTWPAIYGCLDPSALGCATPGMRR